MMWGFGGVFFILCMAFMLWMMFGHGTMGHDHGDKEQRGTDTPERILAERFASGEIDIEEYEQRLEALGKRDRSAHK
jgi:uncharacterized membrane protein